MFTAGIPVCGYYAVVRHGQICRIVHRLFPEAFGPFDCPHTLSYFFLQGDSTNPRTGTSATSRLCNGFAIFNKKRCSSTGMALCDMMHILSVFVSIVVIRCCVRKFLW